MEDIDKVARGLGDLIGPHAELFFGIALLAFGLSATSVGTLAGQVGCGSRLGCSILWCVPDWLLWLIASGLLAVGEIATLAFILGPVALAALATAGVAALGVGMVVQLAVFIVASLASLAIVRPIAQRHLRTPAKIRTGTAALVGESAVVLERVDQLGGRIKLGGEIWSARALDGAGTFDPGAHVHVVEIAGATAIVMG